jgi:hypothetical protein
VPGLKFRSFRLKSVSEAVLSWSSLLKVRAGCALAFVRLRGFVVSARLTAFPTGNLDNTVYNS